MKPLSAMMILAFGPLQWSFPAWLWTFFIAVGFFVAFYKVPKESA